MTIHEYIDKYKNVKEHCRPRFYNNVDTLFQIDNAVRNLTRHIWPEALVDFDIVSDDNDEIEKIFNQLGIVLDRLTDFSGDIHGYLQRYFETVQYYESAENYVKIYDSRDPFIPLYNSVAKFLEENHIFDDKASRQYTFSTIMEYLIKLRNNKTIKQHNLEIFQLVDSTIKDLVKVTKLLGYEVVKNHEVFGRNRTFQFALRKTGELDQIDTTIK